MWLKVSFSLVIYCPTMASLFVKWFTDLINVTKFPILNILGIRSRNCLEVASNFLTYGLLCRCKTKLHSLHYQPAGTFPTTDHLQLGYNFHGTWPRNTSHGGVIFRICSRQLWTKLDTPNAISPRLFTHLSLPIANTENAEDILSQKLNRTTSIYQHYKFLIGCRRCNFDIHLLFTE